MKVPWQLQSVEISSVMTFWQMSSAVLAYCFSGIIGYLILRLFLREEERGWFLMFLAPGCGLAITTAVLFLNLHFISHFSWAFLVFIHLLLFLALTILVFRNRQKFKKLCFLEKKVFFTVLALGLLLLVAHFLKSPYGGGLDVWAVWKLKARFLFYGSWKSIFFPGIGFSHGDYPLFYPLALCWGWLAAGGEWLGASWVLSSLVTLSMVGLAMASMIQKGWKAVGLIGLFLISAPHLIGMGASGYADIFIAYFALAAALLLMKAFQKESSAYFFSRGFF